MTSPILLQVATTPYRAHNTDRDQDTDFEHGLSCRRAVASNLYESEADQRSINTRIEAIEEQKKSHGQLLGAACRPPVQPISALSPTPESTALASPTEPCLPLTEDGICVIYHQEGAYERPLVLGTPPVRDNFL